MLDELAGPIVRFAAPISAKNEWTVCPDTGSNWMGNGGHADLLGIATGDLPMLTDLSRLLDALRSKEIDDRFQDMRNSEGFVVDCESFVLASDGCDRCFGLIVGCEVDGIHGWLRHRWMSLGERTRTGWKS